jgi:LysM domain-containing protein
MSLVIATPSTAPGTRRRTSGRSANHAAARTAARPSGNSGAGLAERNERPRLAVVPAEVPLWSATTVPVSGRVALGDSEARLRARRAHPAGKGRRLSAVPVSNVVAFQSREPFDQCAEPVVDAVVEPVVAAEPAAAALRLTARGQAVLRVVVAVGLALVVAAAVLLIGRQAQAGESGKPLPVTYRVVLPGETLWEIAGKVAPSADRRDTVEQIEELNALPGASVSAGQRIAVPAADRS